METLGLDVRARKGIRRAISGTRQQFLGNVTIADLCKLTPDKLLSQKNFGASTLSLVQQQLAVRGLSLAADDPISLDPPALESV